MLEMANQTAWPAGIFQGWAADRRPQYTVVIKTGYGFDLDGRLQPLEPPRPIALADEYHGDPRRTSLKTAGEIAPFKQGGEVLLSGTAHPPRANAIVMETVLGIRFADGREWSKVLRVTGERRWRRTLLGVAPDDPAVLSPLPLRYEFTFGGVDIKRRALERRNPVGMGFSRNGRPRPDAVLPRIGQGPRFLGDPARYREPAGYAPLAPGWAPRSAVTRHVDAGAAAGEGGCPYASAVSPQLYNAAPTDQRFPESFRGGETLLLRGFFRDRPELRFQLPEERPQAILSSGAAGEVLALACDTLLIDTDAREVHLIWRGAVPDAKDARKRWVLVTDRDIDEQTHEDKEAMP